MKKLMLMTMIMISAISFSRDYERNEVRDIVIPMEENHEKLSNLSEEELANEIEIRDRNIEFYSKFHSEL